MIYLDNAATTLPYPGSLASITNSLELYYGNPSSIHSVGLDAAEMLERARNTVADWCGAEPEHVVFTSGATEANNIICHSFANRHCLSSEHSSIIKWHEPHQTFASLDDLDHVLDSACAEIPKPLISTMYANNETGHIYYDESVLRDLKQKHIFHLHVDAVAAAPHIPLDFANSPADSMSISGHKLHALKGIGVLLVKDKDGLGVFRGGNHEFGVRPGTENMIGILSLEHMAEKYSTDSFFRARVSKVAELRDSFEQKLLQIPGVEINASQKRVPHISSVFFPQILDQLSFITLLSDNGLCAAGMSACNSRMPKNSHVLEALFGKDSQRTSKSIRFSFSCLNTAQDVYNAIEVVKLSLSACAL